VGLDLKTIRPEGKYEKPFRDSYKKFVCSSQYFIQKHPVEAKYLLTSGYIVKRTDATGELSVFNKKAVHYRFWTAA
jgi:hypothetical protein